MEDRKKSTMETANRNVARTAKRNALTGLGTRLRAARENTGLTQQAVAERIGVSTQTLRNWEAGRHEPTQEAIARLASLYAVQLQGLRAEAPIPHDGTLLRNPNQRVRVDPQVLVQARREAGLPQAKAAEQSGIKESSLRRYEHGKARPTRATLRRLAIAYGKPTSWEDPEAGPSETATIEPPHMDDVLRAYLKVQPDLDEESVGLIADFILFTHQRQMSRSRE